MIQTIFNDFQGIFNLVFLLFLLISSSLLTGLVAHIVLSVRGNRFATEASCLLSMTVYVGVEFVFGIFSLALTLPVLVVVTLLMVGEAFKPMKRPVSKWPEVVEVLDDQGEAAKDVLCFTYGRGYSALAVISITSIPMELSHDKKRELGDELKWLYPFWEEGQQSQVTYALDTKIERGLAALRFTISAQDKDPKRACDTISRTRHIVETWLTRNEYDFESVESDSLWEDYLELESILSPTAQEERTELGFLLINGVPTSSEHDISQLIQQLLKVGVSGRVFVSFKADKIPHLRKNMSAFQSDPQQQTRVPYKVEEHNLRETYKQMTDIEACEETGSFRVSTSVIVEEQSKGTIQTDLNRTTAAIHSVWGGVNVTSIPLSRLVRSWHLIALRRFHQRTTQITGARLSELLQISESLPGVPTRVVAPVFGLPKRPNPETDAITIGQVLQRGRPTSLPFEIETSLFPQNTGIWGNPGSGKTITAQTIVCKLHKKAIPFLIIVPAKREWRRLTDYIPDIRIFTAGDESTAPFRFNFFDVPAKVPINTHINNVTLCFIATWPNEGILTEHISKMFHRTYELAGWDSLTNKRGRPILLTDLHLAMQEVVKELEYGEKLKQDFAGALKARIESLLKDKVLSVMLNTEQGLSISDLLNHSTILEIRNLPDTQMALLTSLIMAGVAEYLEAQEISTEQKLRHLLVLEEVHHVLKRIPGAGLSEGHSAQQQAINSLTQTLREARGLGLGVLLLDQLPGELAEAAIKLPGITIIHALKDVRERLLVGGQANLNDEQLLHAGSLKRGEAIVHLGFSDLALNVQIDYDHRGEQETWTDERVRHVMKNFYQHHPHLRTQNLPVISFWKPDPSILDELKLLVANPDLLAKYRHQRSRGQSAGLAELRQFVEFVAGKLKANMEAKDISEYSSLLAEFIESLPAYGGGIS